MTKQIAAIAILFLSATASAQQTITSPVHVGFCYPLSTHGIYARDYSNTFSVHALVGVSGGEKGFSASGISNLVYGSTRGFTLAGFSNHITDNAKGFVGAGFMNTINYKTHGVQAAGFANISGSTKGAQLAGFINISSGNIKGFQGAGFANITSKNVKGAQVSGFMNMADTVNTQAAGFINIAKDAKVQVSGFMNIADSCDYPIGIINIIRKGEKSIGLSVDGSRTTMATFRSGGRVLYGIAGIGYNYTNKSLYALETGIGAHITLSKAVRFNMEISTSSYTDLTDELFITSSFRFLPALTFGKHIELFAGPSINIIQRDEKHNEVITHNYVWSNYDLGTFSGLYISGCGGINFRF